MNKLFIIQKYVKARSVSEAIRKEKTAEVSDVYLDDTWKKEAMNRSDSSFGIINEKKR